MADTPRLVLSLPEMTVGGLYQLECDSGSFTIAVEDFSDGVVEGILTTQDNREEHLIFDGHSCRVFILGWVPTQQGFLDGLRPMRDQMFMGGHCLQMMSYVFGEFQHESLGPNCRITQVG